MTAGDTLSMVVELRSRARATTDQDSPTAQPRSRADLVTPIALGLATALWLVSLLATKPENIGQYGLLSAFPPTMFLVYVVLAGSMLRAIHRRESTNRMVAHLVLFVLVLHGTPALLFGTLRYGWAWKHLGLVDYLVRHRSVNPHSPTLTVYHNWPGFFTAVTSWLAGSGAGLKVWVVMAQWSPPFFELLDLLALYAIAERLTDDRRVVWLTCWFFAIGNWVGQDYFSPQAFAYFLYLVTLAVIVRLLARHPPLPHVLNRFVRRVSPDAATPVAPNDLLHRRGAIALVVLLGTAIGWSHPLTPIVLLVAIVLLTLTSVVRVYRLALYVAAPIGLFMATAARSYLVSNTKGIVARVGDITGNVNQNLTKAANATAAQHLVSSAGRAEVVLLIIAASAGILRRIRVGSWDLAAGVLAATPLAILVAGSYGGEAVFRVYLFAVPFLAFFAAAGCYPTLSHRRWFSAALAGALTMFVLVGTLFAYYGKEAWTYFSTSEVHAAELVYATAPVHSLLVEGTADYPTQFERSENFTYVDLSSEPAPSIDKVLAHPAPVLYAWLADRKYSAGYLIITRAQKAETDELGLLPRGSLAKIEAALLASPQQFQVVYHDADASVFSVARVLTGTSP